MPHRIAHVDADVLVYNASFGAQKTRYRYKGRVFESHKDMKAYLNEQGKQPKEVEYESFVEYLDESVVNIIAQRLIDDIIENAGTERLRFYLTGKGNYRETVATIKPYKGNRTADKPVHFQYAKELFLNKYEAELHEGQEADDAIGIAQYDSGCNDVICTIDKDLNMLEGRHFDWNKQLRYKVNRDTGLLYFHCQMLAGDSTDNIPGINKIGMVKAQRRLNSLDLKEQRLAIRELYNEQYGEDADEAMQEVATLLWIRRKPDQIINFLTGDYLK